MASKDLAFQHIKTLHNAVTRNYNSVDELLASYLEAGRQIFDLDVGIASRIEGNSYTILAVSQNPFEIAPGAVFELEGTYCREVHSQQQTVHVHNAGETDPFKSHPIYENLKLESYISSPIFVHGELYGTLNFSSTKRKTVAFESYEVELNEMMAESVGRFVENKLAQERDQKNLEHMYNLAKLSTLGEMAGGIAHEINNPLAIISGSSSVAQTVIQSELVSPPPLLLESLERIDNTVHRISKIVGGMKRLINDGKIDQLDPNSLSEVIDTSLSISVERIRSRGVQLKTQLDANCIVECNAGQISQILTNLLSNALDAVKDTDSPWIQVDVKTANGACQLRVTDSGNGVKAGEINKIFDPFYTTKDPGKGTGLGLSISSRIADQHGGRLFLDSQSENTCFVLELPASKGPVKKAS